MCARLGQGSWQLQPCWESTRARLSRTGVCRKPASAQGASSASQATPRRRPAQGGPRIAAAQLRPPPGSARSSGHAGRGAVWWCAWRLQVGPNRELPGPSSEAAVSRAVCEILFSTRHLQSSVRAKGRAGERTKREKLRRRHRRGVGAYRGTLAPAGPAQAAVLEQWPAARVLAMHLPAARGSLCTLAFSYFSYCASPAPFFSSLLRPYTPVNPPQPLVPYPRVVPPAPYPPALAPSPVFFRASSPNGIGTAPPITNPPSSPPLASRRLSLTA